MSVDLVSFPVAFGDRSCDRDFVLRLMRAGEDRREFCELIQFKLWFAFSKGSGPSMEVNEMTDAVLSELCGWPVTKASDLIKAALDSKFMALQESGKEKRYLLSGFSDANRGSLSKVTAKGGSLSWVNRQLSKSRQDAGELFKYMEAKGSELVQEDPELVNRAIVIGVNLCRSVGIDVPSDKDFENGVLAKCKRIAEEFDEQAMIRVYRFIALNKGDESIVPRNRDLLLKREKIRKFSEQEV